MKKQKWSEGTGVCYNCGKSGEVRMVKTWLNPDYMEEDLCKECWKKELERRADSYGRKNFENKQLEAKRSCATEKEE